MAMVFPAPVWFVLEMITFGLTLLVGPPKGGKSWLCLNIGVWIATGGMALGQIKVAQHEVLYLALEDNKRRLQSRLKMILQGNPAPEGLHIVFDWPVMDLVGLTKLRKWLDDHPNVRVVLIDTFVRVRATARWVLPTGLIMQKSPTYYSVQ
jgi:RecA-family ATPase